MLTELMLIQKYLPRILLICQKTFSILTGSMKVPDGTPITYREHDVNNKNPGSTRDAQRFVTGSDGSVYYTDDRYSTFTKLK